MGNRNDKKIRGIRSSMRTLTMLGRLSPGEGDVEMFSISEVLNGFLNHNGQLTTFITNLVNSLFAFFLANNSNYLEMLVYEFLETVLMNGPGIIIESDGIDTITISSTITQYTDAMARAAVGPVNDDSFYDQLVTSLTEGPGIVVSFDEIDTVTISSTITQYTDAMARAANSPNDDSFYDQLVTSLTEGSGIRIDFDEIDTVTIGLLINDDTINNTTTSAHGYAPKLSGDSTTFLNGNGGFTVPPGTASTVTQYTDDMVYDQMVVSLTEGPGITISFDDIDTITISNSITWAQIQTAMNQGW